MKFSLHSRNRSPYSRQRGAALGAPLLLGALAAGGMYFFSSYIVAGIGSFFITAASYILTVAGLFFNWLFEAFIINFRGTLDSMSITPGIDIVWTVFRDISNILIIGFFAFIAISIILGLKQFGEKRLIATVLVVAVLMNFSLLFTKIIVDVSNFTAYQFYKSAITLTPSGAAAGTASVASTGLSGAFLQKLGIQGFFDTFGAIQEGALKNGSLKALFSMLAATVLIFVVAWVFFYGAFLMALRAVQIVILMIMAPLAFASHLIPSLEEQVFGWKTWWSQLLRCAVFAPLLAIFLWASLLILQNAPTNATGMANVLINPASADGTATILIYVFTVGLLLASIKMANSLSGSFAGFGFASSWAKLTAFAPFAVAGKGLGALAQQTIGKRAYRQKGVYEASAKDDLMDAARAQRSSKIHELHGNTALAQFAAQQAKLLNESAKEKLEKAQKLGKTADRTFNPNDIGFIKSFAKKIGAEGIGTGARGYATTVKTRAEEGSKAAAALALDRDERRVLEDESKSIVATQQHNQAEVVRSAIEAAHDSEKDRLETELNDARAQHRDAEMRQENERAQAALKIVREREEDIRKLREKEFEVTQSNGTKIAKTLRAAQSEAAQAKRQLEAMNENSTDLTKRTARSIANIANDASANLAADMAAHHATGFEKMFGADKDFAKAARSQYKKSQSSEARLLKTLKDAVGSNSAEKPAENNEGTR
jgi:hypothetical protein